MSEKTLEQRMENWLVDGDNLLQPADDIRERIHRFLQLARREGFWCGWGEREVRNVTISQESVYALARGAFPITRTVEEPRVEPDPHGALATVWRVQETEFGRSIYRSQDGGKTWTNSLLGLAATEKRIRLWAALLDEPTVTTTVKE